MAGPLPVAGVTLSAEEWSLVAALREVPPSPLRTRVVTLIDTLLRFVAEPKCAEMQGDGVPCSTAAAHCDECVHVDELLETLTARALPELTPPRKP